MEHHIQRYFLLTLDRFLVFYWLENEQNFKVERCESGLFLP